MNQGYQKSLSLQAFLHLTNIENKVYLLLCDLIKKRQYMSQEQMAKELGCSREHVNRAIKELVTLDLIIKDTKVLGYTKRVCFYALTKLGRYWRPYMVTAYKLAKNLIFSIGLLIPVARENVTLVKFIGNIGGISSFSKRELQTAPERARVQKSPMTVRKEVTVSKEHSVDIPKHVQDVTTKLHLTVHGQCKLSVFNKETVDYALAMIKQSNSKNVFKDILEQCIAYSKSNDIPVEWSAYYQARDAGLFKKEDYYTSKKLTIEMLKGSSSAPRKEYQQSDKQAELIAKIRAKSKQDTKEWAQNNYQRVLKQAQFQGEDINLFAEKFINFVTGTESDIDCRQSGDTPPEESGYEEVLD